MEDVLKCTLEIKIQKFVIQYGSEQLIEWIDEFDCMGGAQKFKQFKKLQRLACNTLDITIADMASKSINEAIDARRIISFIAFGKINLPHKTIAKLLGNVSLRSVAYYIKDTETWINDPRGNRIFVEAYNKVCDKFNAE